MTSEQIRSERLKAEIELKRAALAEYRAVVLKLQQEIAKFAQQYDRIIGPLEAQLDAVRQEIEALQGQPVSNPYNTNFQAGSIWGPYGSFEESFDAKYRQSNNPRIEPKRKPPVDDNTLRTLYRKLARKFHPDTTTDPAEKARLTIIMAQVNAAYRAKNIDELYALDGQRAPGPIPPPDPNPAPIKPREPTYVELMALNRKLDDEIAEAKSEHQRLLTSPLMSLKIEYSLARSQGRDLLREIAAKVRADLDTAKVELKTLRRSR